MARLIGNISYLTVVEAATELETTNTRILMLLRGQVLAGKQLEGEWYVESASVTCARARGADVKTAVKCAGHCTGGCK